MDLGEAMIVAGIGCRKGAPQEDILAAIAHALEAAMLTPDRLDLIATAAEKGGEDGIAAAAAAFGCPLVLVPSGELRIAGEKAVTRSERVVALFAVPSVAEAAALAAAGDGARLIAPRRVAGMATCAIAASGEDAGDAS
ncbi:MAG TPA: cobalamin biosynthesis protein [Kaistia sp.]|nr:cobalamin biosynthesis protein [Kaistia sp.]